MQVISRSMEVGTSISSKSMCPAAAPEPPALAAALSRCWARCRSCWFRRRPSLRRARMASTWSRLQRHAPITVGPTSPSAVPTLSEGNPWAQVQGHPAFLGPGPRKAKNDQGRCGGGAGSAPGQGGWGSKGVELGGEEEGHAHQAKQSKLSFKKQWRSERGSDMASRRAGPGQEMSRASSWEHCAGSHTDMQQGERHCGSPGPAAGRSPSSCPPEGRAGPSSCPPEGQSRRSVGEPQGPGGKPLSCEG